MCAFIVVLGASACKKTGAGSNVALRSPSAMAVAGDLLFIANAAEDSVQALQLTDDLTTFDFVTGDTLFFPLRMQTGPLPIALATLPASTLEHAHRLVAVLSRGDGLVRVIDAEPNVLALSPDATASNASQAVALSVGGADVHASAMVASPRVACRGSDASVQCRGYLYVALSAIGQIAEIEVRGGVGSATSQRAPVTLLLNALYDVGGSPSHLAMHPAGDVLYFTDADDTHVMQLAITNTVAPRSTVWRFDVDVLPGPIAVSTEGHFVVVGRPALQDVVIIDVSNPSHLALVAANGRGSSTPRCLQTCVSATPPIDVCTDTLPTDTIICVSDGGYDVASDSAPYNALFVDMTPAALGAFGSNVTASIDMPDMEVACAPITIASDGTVTTNTTDVSKRVYKEFVAVMGLDGAMRFIGLPDAQGSPSLPEVMSSMHCQTPTLTRVTELQDKIVVDAALQLSDFLAPCPSHPSDTARMQCIQTDDAAAGVLAWSGHTLDKRWMLAWEGILVDRSIGGAQLIGSTKELIDSGVDLVASGVQVGDWLEILTSPVPNAPTSCAQDVCGRNRKITEVSTESDGRSRLVTDDPIDPACFGSGSPIVQYRVRVGDAFWLTPPAGRSVRLDPGQMFGPGRAAGNGQRLAFAVPALSGGLTSESLAAMSACERYDSDGRPKAGMMPFMSRKAPVGFKVMDQYAPVTSGSQFDLQGAVSGNVGQLPTAMVVAPRSNGGTPVAFVTYGVSNALLAFVPFDTTDLFGVDRYRVFR